LATDEVFPFALFKIHALPLLFANWAAVSLASLLGNENPLDPKDEGLFLLTLHSVLRWSCNRTYFNTAAYCHLL